MRLSDCPHRPGTPEHTAWVHDVYLPWQHFNPEQRAQREAGHREANELWKRIDSQTDEQRKAAATMREVEEATSRRVASSVFFDEMTRVVFGGRDISRYLYGVSFHVVVSPAAKALQDFQAAINRMADQMRVAVGMTADQVDEWLKAADDVKPRAESCRHGNPRNACRECSMGRR